jgi:integrase
LSSGCTIPAPTEVRAVLAASSGRWRAFVSVAALAGLRLSELRGIAWRDVDFAAATVTVRQRADAWGDLGSPKAAASRRTIPVPPLVIKALKEWKLAYPKGDFGLVFPDKDGSVAAHGHTIPDAWQALQVSAGVSVPALDKDGKAIIAEDGKPVMRAKYPGLHALAFLREPVRSLSTGRRA